MHVGFKLEEVQMPPAAQAVIVQGLVGRTTGGASRFAGVPSNVQVNPVCLDIQRYLSDLPGSN